MPRSYRRMLSNFRCGSLKLKVETGRYEKIPLKDRICTHCSDNEIENEMHVLLHCRLYNDLRYELFQHINALDENFSQLPPLTQFCTIMTTGSCQFILAKYLYKLMKRRALHDIN